MRYLQVALQQYRHLRLQTTLLCLFTLYNHFLEQESRNLRSVNVFNLRKFSCASFQAQENLRQKLASQRGFSRKHDVGILFTWAKLSNFSYS